MASSRKLQGEIDRVLKQVQEHMVEFDQIWQKVHTAPTPNLKEKYEGDLKKEIKKLQRFRDQIKSWAASNDIKNKKPLLDARRAIETEMERFKVLEKETKTKAYSKEGLNAAARQRSESSGGPSGRDDPAKQPTFQWLDELEQQLEQQVEEMEEKAEAMKSAAAGKKSKKHTESRVEEVLARISKHQYHIEQIQTIKDRLEGEDLDVALVEDIKDDLEYYVQSHNDVDFQEDETLYDNLHLDEEPAQDKEDNEEEDQHTQEDEDTAADADADADADEDENADEDAEAEEEEADPIISEAPAGTLGAIFAAAGAKPAATPSKSKQKQSSAASSAIPASSPLASAKGSKSTSGTAPSSVAGPTPVMPQSSPTTAAGKTESLASIIMKQKQQQQQQSTQPQPSQPVPAPSTVPAPTSSIPAPQSAASPSFGAKSAPVPAPKPPTATLVASAVGTTTGAGPSKVPTGLPTIAPSQLGRLPAGAKTLGASQPMMPPPGLSSQTPPPGLGLGTGLLPGAHATGGTANAPDMSSLSTAAGTLQPPVTGATPSTSTSALPSSTSTLPSTSTSVSPAPLLSTKGDRSLLPDDYFLIHRLADPSLRSLPDPSDTERQKQYLPRNPYRTPSYFPSLPAPIFDDPLLFEKLSVDSLFFIFYFQQGTPHQYLAARELKKQSWRYHKNFLTWFQRHDDPKVTTDEYEQGTYVYFDYESGWCQRIKADFTFEYRHLEDELTVPMASTL